MSDWGEEVKGHAKAPAGTWQVLVTGVGKNKDGNDLVGQGSTGPWIGIQLAAADGSFEVRDMCTLNSNAAWKVKKINKALGMPPSNLVNILQARDAEITEKNAPPELLRQVINSWVGKQAWVTVTYPKGTDNHPVVEWEVAKPLVTGAAAASPPKGDDTPTPFAP